VHSIDAVARLIREQMAEGDSLLWSAFNSDTYTAWEAEAANYLGMAVGVKTQLVHDFRRRCCFGAFPVDADESWWQEREKMQLAGQLMILAQVLDLLPTWWKP